MQGAMHACMCFSSEEALSHWGLTGASLGPTEPPLAALVYSVGMVRDGRVAALHAVRVLSVAALSVEEWRNCASVPGWS